MNQKRKSNGEFATTPHGVERIESKKFPLSGGSFMVMRMGQEKPQTSNKVKVLVAVSLPTDEKETSGIDTKLRFGPKLRIMEESLFWNWGKECKGARKAYAYFSAKTWREAFNRGEKYGREELQKLEKALHNRMMALHDAEF